MLDFLEEMDKELKDIKLRLDNLERADRSLLCEIEHINKGENEND